MSATRVIFITGTGTGVGKTKLTSLWVRHLLGCGALAVAVKPLSSGAREDAQALRAAQGWQVSLDAVNPWHFRVAQAPLLAARRAGVKVGLEKVVAFCRRAGEGKDVLLVEGAGGLLSPLGEGFDAPDLIRALEARVVVTGWNQLGILNEMRLTLAHLPARVRREAMVCLMVRERLDPVRRSNVEYLREWLGATRVVEMPFLPDPTELRSVRVMKVLDRLSAGLGMPGAPD